APHREIADGSVEIDVDHTLAADQVIYIDGATARLQQLRFDDLAAATRFWCRLRIDDEAFAGIILYLACILGNDDPGDGVPDRRLLFSREAFPGRTHGQPRHSRDIEHRGKDRRKAFIALAHAEPRSLLDRWHQLLIVAFDFCDGGTRRLASQWHDAEQHHHHPCPKRDRRAAPAELETLCFNY